MKSGKGIGILFILLGTCFLANAQTIFSYGDKTVSKAAFLQAFSRNQQDEKINRETLMNYLNLYADFRIKVQAAKDMRLDTLQHLADDLRNFREQMISSYLNDEASIELLTREMLQHAQKDILLAHIYIEGDFNTEEGIKAAEETARRAYAELEQGAEFSSVALKYSKDPEVKSNRGTIGYITALSLPYNFEAAAYALMDGKHSAPFRSDQGFHIFKNLDERPAAGRMKVAHIQLAFPPDIDSEGRDEIRRLADSVYQLLKGGLDFTRAAAEYSDDHYTATEGGQLEPFGPGVYDPVFEKAAFSLKHDGDLSAPVQTSFGYHIIKRLEHLPAPSLHAEADFQDMKDRVRSNPDIMQVARKALVRTIHQQASFREYPFDRKEFYRLTRSIASRSNTAESPLLKASTPLFSLREEEFTFSDWSDMIELLRGNTNLNTSVQIDAAYQEFIDDRSIRYYQEHLEELNPAFRQLLEEFNEGNLLFEVMQQKVWEAAMNDSLGLKGYYDNHTSRYTWEPSADAILIQADHDSLVQAAKKQLNNNISNWTILPDQYDGRIRADSGRFEYSQLPVAPAGGFRKGIYSAAVKDPEQGWLSFVYIIRTYKGKDQKRFDEARGLVISDYQEYLEQQWMAELRKKYPLKINQEVVDELLNSIQ